mgnify:CR=1 FL=1
MSELTEPLTREHEIILRHLTRLERALWDHTDESMRAELNALRGVLVPHRRKEEEVLFRELTLSLPVQCLLDEHEEEERLIGTLRSALDSGDRDTVVRSGQSLLDHLRNHIWKEDHILYPMAEQSIEGEARNRVLAGFRQEG